jgi:hypothetical protein
MDPHEHRPGEKTFEPPPDPPAPADDGVRQEWPIADDERTRIVDWLAATGRRGSKDNQGNPVSTRHALRAMRTLASYSRSALRWQKLQHHRQQDEAQGYALKHYVTPVVELAGDRAHAEAMRRGLDCAAALPVEERDAIYDQAEAELKAAGVDTDPFGVDKPKPAARGTWVVPRAYQAEVMRRLVGMVDPLGLEATELRPRERLMAARVLGLFDRLALEQEEFDRAVRAAGPVFDRAAALAEMEELVQKRLVERRREAEEFRARLEAMEAEERAGRGGPAP